MKGFSRGLRPQTPADVAKLRQKKTMIDIIIPNYNGMAYLSTCLDALRQQTRRDFVVTVVDDGSTDGSVALLAREYPEVRVLALRENNGFVQAVNAGIAATSGDYVVLLNNDTEVTLGWLAALVGALEAQSEYSFAASKLLLFDQRDTFHSAGDGYRSDGVPFSRGVWQRDTGQFEHQEAVFGPCAGAAAYRRSVLDELADDGQVFDQDLGMYCEDVDLNLRAWRRGLRTVYVPEAVVYHRLSATGGGWRASYGCGRNFMLVWVKNMPVKIIRRAWFALVISQLGFALHSLWHIREHAARARLRGQFDGLRALPQFVAKRRDAEGRSKREHSIDRGGDVGARCAPMVGEAPVGGGMELGLPLEGRSKREHSIDRGGDEGARCAPTNGEAPRWGAASARIVPPSSASAALAAPGQFTPSMLSVVIPAYNEQRRLPETLRQVLAYLALQPYASEVIVADDGSTDDTAVLVEQMQLAQPTLRLLRLDHRGKGFAVRAGALASQGQYVLLCDADLATPIEEWEKLAPFFQMGYDLVIGSREGAGARRVGEPWYRHVMGRVFNMIVQIVAIPGINDTQCGFKGFTHRAAHDLFSRVQLYGDDARPVVGAAVTAFDVEVLFLARRLGYRTREVPTLWEYGTETKVDPLRDSYRNFRDVLAVRWNALRGRYPREQAALTDVTARS